MNDEREEQKRESGMPGGGKGRKDVVGRTGVFPVSRSEGASPDAVIHDQASFGQGARGAEGYEDSGGSELFYYEAELKEQETSAPGVFDSSIREGRINMKVLKPLPHSIIDYLWAGTMMAAPWLFGFRKNKRATINSISAGAGILGLSLMTKYPLGAVKLIPFPVHGVIEAVAGGLTALDPWILGFSDNKRARWTHVIAGLGTLAVVAMTDYQAAESRARRSLARGRGAGLAEQMRNQPDLTPAPAPDLGPPTHLPEDAGAEAAQATKSRA